MNLWPKTTSRKAADTSSRTPRERARRAREIRAIDANTSSWLRRGGLDPKRKGR